MIDGPAISSKRAERWFRSAKSCPDLNRPVYDRMAQVLFDGLNAFEGDHRHVEATAVLLRTLAIVTVAALNGSTPDEVESRCNLLCAGIRAEIDSLSRIAKSTVTADA